MWFLVRARATASTSNSRGGTWEMTSLPESCMDDVDALIERRMEEVVTRFQATEKQSLQGQECQLDHDTIEHMITDVVRAEMTSIRVELFYAAIDRGNRRIMQLMDHEYGWRVKDLSPRDSGDDDNGVSWLLQEFDINYLPIM